MTLKQRIEKLNRKMNEKTYEKVSKMKIPESQTNKILWKCMFDAGFRVIARRINHSEQQWYLAAESTFEVNTECEFKLAEKDWEEGVPF